MDCCMDSGRGTRRGGTRDRFPRRLIIPVLGLLALGLLAARIAAADEIDSLPAAGLVLTQPGKYVVTQDLTYAGDGAAITLAANDVVLDMRGHRLTGPGPGTGAYGIYVPSGTGAVIENGTVSGFDYGVLLDLASSQASVSGMIVQGNHDGIAVVGSGCTIMANTAIGNDAAGIVVLEGEANTISGNIAEANQNGIAVINADRNTLTVNTAAGNTAAGITVSGSIGNALTGNTTHCNDRYDLADDSACANTWSDNCFFTTDGSPCLGEAVCPVKTPSAPGMSPPSPAPGRDCSRGGRSTGSRR